MKSLSIKKILIAAIFIFTYIYMIIIEKMPLLYLFLAYLILGILLVIVFFSDVLAFLGNYYFIAGNLDKASKIYNYAVSKSMSNATIYLNYSILLVREGNPQLALEILLKTQNLKKKLITEKNILLTMGSCYWVLGDIDKAIEILEGMRQKYDYVNNHVLTTLGYMYLIKDDLAKALDCTNLAIKDAPESGSAWDNLGQIYLKQSETEKAKDAFKKAIGFNQNLVDSYYYLGLIALQEQDIKQAVAYLERAKQCTISPLNTVTLEQIDSQLKELNP